MVLPRLAETWEDKTRETESREEIKIQVIRGSFETLKRTQQSLEDKIWGGSAQIDSNRSDLFWAIEEESDPPKEWISSACNSGL